MNSRLLSIFLVMILGMGKTTLGDEEENRRAAAWNGFLLSGNVFGDYSEAEFDHSMAINARSLIKATIDSGNVIDKQGNGNGNASLQERRLAIRAIWVGVNLEYVASLQSIDEVKRRAFARQSLKFARQLRGQLQRDSIYELEPDPRYRLAWQRSMLTLDMIERELSAIVPNDPVSVSVEVRLAILDEFHPANVREGSPNASVLMEVASAFRELRDLAKKAISATVQGSLALGAAYGYPPEVERATVEKQLSIAHGDIEKFYPTKDDWSDWIMPLVQRTDGGGSKPGIVRLYSTLRNMRVAADWNKVETWWRKSKNEKSDDKSAGVPFPIGNQLLPNGLEGLPKNTASVQRDVGVDSLTAALVPIRGKLFQQLHQSYPGSKPTNGGNRIQEAPPLDLKKPILNSTSEQEVKDFSNWLEAKLGSVSNAKGELVKVQDEWMRALTDGVVADALPVGDDEYNALVQIAKTVIEQQWLDNANPDSDKPSGPWKGQIKTKNKIPDGEEGIRMRKQVHDKAVNLIDSWLFDWIQEQVDAFGVHVPDQLNGKQVKGATTKTDYHQANGRPTTEGNSGTTP